MFFQEIPRLTTVAGAAVIVMAGLLALRMANQPHQEKRV
jgi:drug/metabolite transporter (DMT)-like permease